MSRPPGLHRPFVLTAFSVSFSALCRSSCAPKHRHASGCAALPQGPALRSGLCCPGPSSLMRPHPPHSQAQHELAALQLIRAVFAVHFRLGDPRLIPCYHRAFFLNMSPSTTPGSPAAAYTQFLRRQRCLRPFSADSALPISPQIRFTWDVHFEASLRFAFATTCCFVHPPDGSDRICIQPARISTTGLSTVWSPAPSLFIPTVATG